PLDEDDDLWMTLTSTISTYYWYEFLHMNLPPMSLFWTWSSRPWLEIVLDGNPDFFFLRFDPLFFVSGELKERSSFKDETVPCALLALCLLNLASVDAPVGVPSALVPSFLFFPGLAAWLRKRRQARRG
ncbi:hypothetical protein FOZ62_018686, partial [Perkinsus olseni]